MGFDRRLQASPTPTQSNWEMMTLVGWELPLFSSDLEPRELKRLKCGVCGDTWADVQCHRCARQYCAGCEAHVHSTLDDPATHHELCEPCNVCQECQVNATDFYCRDCEKYECDACCGLSHSTSEAMQAHVRISVEGSSAGMLPRSTWESNFRKYTKMVRRQHVHAMSQPHDIIKQEAGALPDYLPLSPSPDHDDEATSDEDNLPGDPINDMVQPVHTEDTVEINRERFALATSPAEPTQEEEVVVKAEHPSAQPTNAEEAVQVKLERVQLSDRQEEKALNTQEPQPSRPPAEVSTIRIKQEIGQPPPTAKRPAARREVVDLTGDDDDDDDQESSASAPTLQVDAKPVVTTTTTTSSVSTPFVSAFAEEDLIRTAMIREYNTLSQQAAEAEHQRAMLSQRAAASGSVKDMLACKHELDVLKNTLIKITHSRTATVARLLFYLHGDEPDFADKLRNDIAMDIPDAEAAFHRRLRDMQTAIDEQVAALQTAQRQMDEVIAIKSGDAYAEVVRLGREISMHEQQVQTLETQRLGGFLQLAHVSAAVRRAALALVEQSKSP